MRLPSPRRARPLDGPDTTERSPTVAGLVRRRQRQRVGGLVALSVALLGGGAVAASALPDSTSRAPLPQSSPSSRATSSPTTAPAASTAAGAVAPPSPTPSPASTADPTTPGLPERTAPWVRGWVDSVELAPTRLWSVSAAEVVVDRTEDLAPWFGDVSRGAVQPGVRVVDAGATIVGFVADVHMLRGDLVGLDAMTGEVRWVKGEEHPRPTSWCAGVSPDGFVVCVGSGGTSLPMELQLLEPTSGEVVRAYPVDHSVDGFGVSGPVAILHGSAGSDATDVAWTGLDVLTGEVVWSQIALGRGEPYEVTGDPVPETVVSWPYARLGGHFSTVVIDVRTGEEVSSAVDPTFADPLAVWAPRDPERMPVLDPWARDERGGPVFGDRDRLRAIDPNTGAVLWETAATDMMPRAVVGDVLVASDDVTATVGLDVMSGRVLWTAPVTGDGAATDGERLLLSSGAVLRVADGAVLRTGDAVGLPPLGRPGRLAASGEALVLYGW